MASRLRLDLATLWTPKPTQQKFLDAIRDAPDMGLVGYLGAFGSGKSWSLCRAAIGLALEYPGIVQLIGRLHFTDLRDTTQKTFFSLVADVEGEMVRQFGRQDAPKLGHHHKSYNNYEFFNGSLIHFRSMDQGEVKYKSLTLGAFGLDEADQISEAALGVLMGRLRQMEVPRVGYLVSNPTAKNHWLYRWFVKELIPEDGTRRRALLRTNTLENADNLPPQYVDNLRRTMTEDQIKRYLEGEWGGMDGDRPVYPFDRTVHVRECPFYKSRPIHIGIDFGYQTPGVVWTQIDPDGRLQVMRRWSPREITVHQMAEGIRQRNGEWFPDAHFRYYAGVDGNTKKDTNERTSAQILSMYGMTPTIRYTHIERGQTIIRQLLALRDDGTPALYVDPVNALMIEGFEGGYYYPAGKDKPIKDAIFAPLFEALRYIVVNIFDLAGHPPGPIKRPAFAGLGRYPRE